MLLLVLLVLALVLMVSGYALKNMAIAYAGGGGWMLLGAHSYTESLATWDIYYCLFFLSMAMVILCILEPVILRKTKEGVEDVSLAGSYGWSDDEQVEEDKATNEEYEHLHAERARVRGLLHPGRVKRKQSKYSRTGEE